MAQQIQRGLGRSANLHRSDRSGNDVQASSGSPDRNEAGADVRVDVLHFTSSRTGQLDRGRDPRSSNAGVSHGQRLDDLQLRIASVHHASFASARGKLMDKLRETLKAVWYAAGPAQYLAFGLWTIVASGLFPLTDAMAIVAAFWKFTGFAVIVLTIWGSMEAKRMAILIGTLFSVAVGAMYMTRFGVFMDGDELRAAMQSRLMAIVLLTGWGYYLANLCTRQIYELRRLGGER